MSLCSLCVLCVSVVIRNVRYNNHRDTENTEAAQRRNVKLGHYPLLGLLSAFLGASAVSVFYVYIYRRGAEERRDTQREDLFLAKAAPPAIVQRRIIPS